MSIDDGDLRREELKQQRPAEKQFANTSVKKPFSFVNLFLFIFTFCIGLLLSRLFQ